MDGCVVGGSKGALQVDIDHGVPVGFRHRKDHTIPEDPGVVNENIEATPGVDGLLNHGTCGVEVRDVGAVYHGLATHGLYLASDFLSR